MARWNSCNILQTTGDTRLLWQFSGNGKMQREVAPLPTEGLPAGIIAKDWQTLFQPKLNVAWLPADQVFLRVVQVPKSDLAETQSMLDLQLEKLSPMPIAQVVWGFEVLQPTATPDAMTTLEGEMQTAIVIIVARSYVEEFLGKLEAQEYLADRLELPLLDQLRATNVREDGAYIYPGAGGDQYSCLVAWWYAGTLRNLSLVHLPATEKRGDLLQEQLMQMAIDVAGFTPADADQLRQAMGSKRSRARMEKLKARLYEGMAESAVAVVGGRKRDTCSIRTPMVSWTSSARSKSRNT